MTTPKKKRRGRQPGTKFPRPGSGKHPIDRDMAKAGYVTQTKAAKILGISKGTLYAWMFKGRIPQDIGGAEVWRRSSGERGATYYNEASLPALKELLMGVPANPAP